MMIWKFKMFKIFNILFIFILSHILGAIRFIALQMDENAPLNKHLVRALFSVLTLAVQRRNGQHHTHTVSFIIKEMISFICRLRGLSQVEGSEGECFL